jgi:glucan phosphorylase
MSAEAALRDFYSDEVARAAGYQTSPQIMALHQAKRAHEYLTLILSIIVLLARRCCSTWKPRTRFSVPVTSSG